MYSFANGGNMKENNALKFAKIAIEALEDKRRKILK